MKSELSTGFSELGSSVKDYINARIDLIRLSMLEKLVKISVFSIMFFVIILASAMVIFFASAAFVLWYGANYQNYFTGLFIVIGAVILLTIIFYLLRKVLVESVIVRKFSSILFQDEDDE